MNLEKSELKIGTVNELGSRLEDALEGSNRDLYRCEGAVTALQAAVRASESIQSHLDKEIEAQKIDLEVGNEIKRWLMRVTQVIANLEAQSVYNRHAQAGRVSAMTTAVDIAKKLKEEEIRKVEAYQVALSAQALKIAKVEAEAAEDAADHVVANNFEIRPGMSLKQRRQLEEAAANAPREAPAIKPVKKPGRPKKR
jgi:hypothetical protein